MRGTIWGIVSGANHNHESPPCGTVLGKVEGLVLDDL